MPFPVLQNRDDILRMLDALADEREAILKSCESLSPAQLNDPVIPGTWSVLKNLQHLAWAEEFMLGWIKKRPGVLERPEFPKEAPLELAALRIALDESHAAAIAFLKGNPESALAEPCKYGRDARSETVGGVFFHLVEHEVGHRAFVRFKLRQLQSV